MSKKIEIFSYNPGDILEAEKVNEIQEHILQTENDIEALEESVCGDNYTKDEVDSKLNDKVDIVEGKGLSTNDYTDLDKAEVEKVKDKQDELVFDVEPTEDSENSVTSGVVYKTINGLSENFNEMIETKVDKETGNGLSTNDYTNEDKEEVGNVKYKQDILTFDTDPKEGSNNPVTSGGVYTEVNNLQNYFDNTFGSYVKQKDYDADIVNIINNKYK